MQFPVNYPVGGSVLSLLQESKNSASAVDQATDLRWLTMLAHDRSKLCDWGLGDAECDDVRKGRPHEDLIWQTHAEEELHSVENKNRFVDNRRRLF